MAGMFDRLRATAIWIDLTRDASRDPVALARAQISRLRRVLAVAAHHPYYRELFRTHRVEPSTATAEDLTRLPPVSKDVYRERIAPPETTGRDRLWSMYTAGSTGKPFEIPLTRAEGVAAQTTFRYACHASGMTARDVVCYLTIEAEDVMQRSWIQRAGFGRQLNLNLRDDPDDNIARLTALAPTVVCSFPSHLAVLARRLDETGRSLPSVRLVLTGGEVLDQDTRALIGAAFVADVRDHYGSAEFSRLAYECPQGTMHVISAAALIECENPDADGIGEALITSFHHRTAPFVRFRIGDRIALGTDWCRCGVSHPTLSRIEGRTNDLFVLPSGRRVSWRGMVRFRDVYGLLEYQIVQKRRDRIEVHVEVGEAFTAQSEERLVRSIRDGCHREPLEVEVVRHRQLERGRTGKLRAAISQVPSVEC